MRVSLCACWLLVAASGRAQDQTTAREEASVHFERGIELVSEEAYAAAAAEFERAYALSSVPAVLYNLGMAYAAAQRPVEATSALERYVQLASDAISETEQQRIEGELARQRARIGRVELVVQPEGAVVRIDGRDVRTSPLREHLRLGVGEHRIEASHADYERAERVLTVVGGQLERVEIALRPASAPKPASVAKLPIRCAVPDVNLFIDDAPVVRTSNVAPAVTTAGSHLVRFQRAGFADSVFRVNLAAGVAPPVDCALRTLPQLPAAVAAKLELREPGPYTALLNGTPLPPDGVVPIGRHRLEVRAPDLEPVTQELTLAPGETRQLIVRVTAGTRDSSPSAASIEGQRSMAYVLGAGGLGLEIAALAVYLAADSKYDRWNREDNALSGGGSDSDSTADEFDRRQRDNDDLLKSIWKMDTTAGALAIGGGCLLLAGGIVLWTATSGTKAQAPRLQLGFRGVGVDVRASL